MYNFYGEFYSFLMEGIGLEEGSFVTQVIVELTSDFLTIFFGLLPLMVCLLIMRKLIIWGD